MTAVKTMPLLAPLGTEFSWILVTRARTLLEATHSLIALNRRRLNPWWGVSGGSEELGSTDDVRDSVRKRLERGHLVLAPRRVWAGRGTGHRCVICSRDILASEVENKISVRSNGHTVDLWTHLPCLTIWREESEAVASAHAGFTKLPSVTRSAPRKAPLSSPPLARAVRVAVQRSGSDVARAVTDVLDWLMALPARKALAVFQGLTDHAVERRSRPVRNALQAARIERRLDETADIAFRDLLQRAADPDGALDIHAEVRRELYRPLAELILSELDQPSHPKRR